VAGTDYPRRSRPAFSIELAIATSATNSTINHMLVLDNINKDFGLMRTRKSIRSVVVYQDNQE